MHTERKRRPSARAAPVARWRLVPIIAGATALLLAVSLVGSADLAAGADGQASGDIRPFTDVTDEALQPEVYESFTRRNGVALFDFDNDGWLDIFFNNIQGERSFLYRNNGDGTFTDVAAEVGLQDTGGNGRGVVAADFNNNGWTDLYVGHAGTIGDDLDFRSEGDQGNVNRLFLNVEGPDGQRTFEDVTEIAQVGDPRSAATIAVADTNGNGLLDIYVANLGDEDFRQFRTVDPTVADNYHRNVLYLNQGPNADGVPIFEDVTLDAGVEGPEQKNRDLDGEPIFTFDPDLEDAEGNPVGETPGTQTHAVLFADVTGDGRPDLFTGDDNGPLTLYRNDGDTTGDGVPNFTDIGRETGINQVGSYMGFATADIDGDGNLEYFVTNMGSQALLDRAGFSRYDLHRFKWGNQMNVLLRNDGTRELPGVGTVPALTNIAPVLDIEPSEAMPPRALDPRNIHPLHEPVFGLEAYEFGFGATFFDLQNNGAPDLYWVGDTASLGRNSGRLLQNAGDGSFRDVTIEAQALTIRDFPYDRVGDPDFDPLAFVEENHGRNTALAAGDLNNNGYVDLVAVIEGRPDEPGQPFILMNGNTGNDWLKVRTVGTDSNRDGVGARVTLSARSAGGPIHKDQVRQVEIGSSYLASEAKELVFGLGRGAGGLELRVEWPSGRVDVYNNIQRNVVFEAVEGEGRPGR